MKSIIDKKDNVNALIIDDDNDTCYLLTVLLKNKSIHSLYANSLAEAKELFEHYIPSIIFLDNQLPDGRGLNFINYVKESFPNVRIIMISAQTADSTKREAIQNGARYFVNKPFKADDMLILINEVLSS